MSGFPPTLFMTCTPRLSRASCLPLSANFSFLVLIGSLIFLPLVLLFPPRRIDLLVPSTERKAHIAASPSTLVALLICCSARNTAHVDDLYPASSNSSVRFVSFRVIVISACSWPSQPSCFFKKFHSPLVIVHPCPGSRHVVRPSVVMILVLSTRSSHSCDESWLRESFFQFNPLCQHRWGAFEFLDTRFAPSLC